MANIGFDFWQCISHYPKEFRLLDEALFMADHNIFVISAVGKGRTNTVEKEVSKLIPNIASGDVHEVVFTHPKQSPELKLAKCKELGITMFFDDRSDVVDLLNENGILAFRVPRKRTGLSDIEAERKA
jgi:hypothetical protein